MLESELAPAVRAHLEAQGYRVYVDPDGTDFLDVVARRGEEIGLVELKVADWKKVLSQAVRRRGWADWVAVALPKGRLPGKAAARPTNERGSRVGVWEIDGGTVRVVRPSSPLRGPGEPDLFPEMRQAILELTDLLDSGALSEGVGWSLAGRARALSPGGRTTADWRLEEFEGGGDEGPTD